MKADEIAVAMVAGAPPEWRSLGNPTAEIRLITRWGELLKLAKSESWGPLMATSGQLVEALVKYRLLGAGYKHVHGKTLGELIPLARKSGLLETGASRRLADTTLSAARILRNWSAHFSLFAKEPGAIQAAQALVLLIATSEAMFPAERTPPRSTVPGLGPSPDNERLAAAVENSLVLAEHVAQFGAPNAIARYEMRLRTHSLPTSDLRNSIAVHFQDVVRNASRNSVKKVIELLLTLRRLDLDEHANIAGILLPADPIFLTDLLRRRSPVTVSMYLAECFKSNPALMSTRLGNPKKRVQFVQSLGAALSTPKGNIRNVANIVRYLPGRVRAEVFKATNTDEFLAWAQASDPSDSVNFLSSLDPFTLSFDTALAGLRDRLVDTIVQSVATAPARSLARLPLRLYRIKAVDPDRSHRILAAVLDRADGLRDWHAARRIIWDTYCFFPDLSDAAVNAALRLVTRDPLVIPVWERVCLVGMLTLSGAALPPKTYVIEGDYSSLPSGLPGDVDRWQGFLFVVGAAKIRRTLCLEPIAVGLLDSIDVLVLNTEPNETKASVPLIGAATAAIQGLRSG